MTVPVSLDRGYAVVPIAVLEDLGWTLSEDGAGIELFAAEEIRVTMRAESPFFRWDGVVLQLTDAPYRSDDGTVVPLQFLTDFLPRRLPGLYDYEGSRSLLRAGDLALLGDASEAIDPPLGPGSAIVADAPSAEESPGDAEVVADAGEVVANAGPSTYDGVRVVVIDAGHGGADPGALGPDGTREKTVALAIALHLEEALREVPELEVHMIRDDDVFVDLWDRGTIATEAKGERPGIFVSIHANSFPGRREARGFETYFLSDARTEHERRVSAIENAPISMGRQSGDPEELADVDFILRDLRNYDHAHWSQNLAGLVQEEIDGMHPGPNRGVKQGVLAVLTNALMPSVLVEVGYLSNRDEAELIARPEFHEDSAEAIADAVVRFFERYPPGAGTGGGGSR
jgi:N-acetylmuramoyl-L-alanine amidase